MFTTRTKRRENKIKVPFLFLFSLFHILVPHGHIKEKEIRQSPGLTDWHVNFYFFGREIVYFVFLFPLSSSLGFEPTLQKIERFDGKGPKRRGEIKTLL